MQRRNQLGNGEGGVYIHIFMFTDHRNNQFQKKLIVLSMIYKYRLTIVKLATALTTSGAFFVVCLV